MKMKLSVRPFIPLGAFFVVTTLTTAITVPEAHARGAYGTAWSQVYPGSSSYLNGDCQLCHADSTQNLNPYGEALCLSTAGAIDARIRDVETLDSDGDATGSNNLAEIMASTQPGWTSGSANPTYDRDTCIATGLVETAPSYIMGDLDPAAGNQMPVANAGGPYPGTVNIPLTFNGSGSQDPDGIIVIYSWDFGDGSTGSGVTPTHTYISDGVFNVTLTVTDDAGDSATASTTATIGLGNQAPVANVNGPYSGMVGDAIAFNSSGSNDPDGSIVSYDWDFGDGSSGTGPNPSHTYIMAGVYNVVLTVMDDAGAMDSAATSATIAEMPVNQAPVANAGGPYEGFAGDMINFDGSGSTDTDGTIIDYHWDFGDGSTGSGMNTGHIYGGEGVYNVVLTVTDDAGDTGSATTTVSIGVANVPPTANAGGPYYGTAGVALMLDGSASSDSDGTITDYAWDFGDGNTGTGAMPMHTYASDGVYTVSLTVTDDAGASMSASTTANISAGNLPPVANAGGPYMVKLGEAIAFDSSASVDNDGSIVSYMWEFGDGNSSADAMPMHTYADAGTYNVVLTVTDNEGAADSAGTTAIVTPLADVFLSKLQAPKTIKTSTTRTASRSVVTIAGGTTMAQDADVSLSADVTGPVVVTIAQNTVTDVVTPGSSTRFRFGVEVSCTGSGTGNIDWTATISAAEDSDTANDTLTGSTSVSCR
ncbi:MAG: PKD domain-containing protein [Gammaproteobacteria bacterium]|nr:PKD domain-containing protein [Gammaproteobacteria bacterium]